jgi:hypothetical protein
MIGLLCFVLAVLASQGPAFAVTGVPIGRAAADRNEAARGDPADEHGESALGPT